MNRRKHLLFLCLCMLMASTIIIALPKQTQAKPNLGKTIKVGKHYKETLTDKKYRFVYHFTAPKTGYYDFVYEKPKYTKTWHELVISGLAAKYYEKEIDETPDYGAFIEDKNYYKLTGFVKKGKKYYITASFVKGAYKKGDNISFRLNHHQHDWSFRSTYKNKVYHECEDCSLVFDTSLKTTASTDTLVYNGSIQNPWIKFTLLPGKATDDLSQKTETVTLNDSYFPKAKFYSISNPKSKNVGTYKVKVTFSGGYKNLKSRSFTYVILPKTSSIQSIDSNADKTKANVPVNVKLTWRKVATQTSGYQIQYADNPNFKNAKTIKISKNTKTEHTIKKLKFKNTCYFRIRTYKKNKKKTYYSAWSKNIDSIRH